MRSRQQRVGSSAIVVRKAATTATRTTTTQQPAPSHCAKSVSPAALPMSEGISWFVSSYSMRSRHLGRVLSFGRPRSLHEIEAADGSPSCTPTTHPAAPRGCRCHCSTRFAGPAILPRLLRRRSKLFAHLRIHRVARRRSSPLGGSTPPPRHVLPHADFTCASGTHSSPFCPSA